MSAIRSRSNFVAIGDAALPAGLNERFASTRAPHVAPRIGERAAARGRGATEGGDERAGMRRALSVRGPALVVQASADNRIALFATAFHAALCGRTSAIIRDMHDYRGKDLRGQRASR